MAGDYCRIIGCGVRSLYRPALLEELYELQEERAGVLVRLFSLRGR